MNFDIMASNLKCHNEVIEQTNDVYFAYVWLWKKPFWNKIVIVGTDENVVYNKLPYPTATDYQ